MNTTRLASKKRREEIYAIRRSNISRMLKEMGLNDRGAAELLGVSPAYIGQILRPIGTKGFSPIGENAARNIAKKLGVTVAELSTRHEQPDQTGIEGITLPPEILDNYPRLKSALVSLLDGDGEMFKIAIEKLHEQLR